MNLNLFYNPNLTHLNVKHLNTREPLLKRKDQYT
jgi:hypothetical protein